MKPTFVFCGPVYTRSGYGDHARSLLKTLFNQDKFNVDILATKWGNTPNTELSDDSEFSKWARENTLKAQMQKQPDVFMQISVANEFKKVGKFNIGVTAGVETTIAPKEFIDGCNQMDLVIVPSKFTKDVLEKTKYEERHPQTKQVVRTFEVNTPIKVLFEGVDLDVFGSGDSSTILEGVEEEFNFLFVGHWLSGDVGHDRKDVGGMIDTFCTIFKNVDKKQQPGLILKTSTAGFSVLDRERIWDKIKSITDKHEDAPPVYLLHGDLTEDEMSNLYHDEKVKAMVSFTKGEGYGRPLCEFTMTGKPVLASGWSGQVDFLDKDLSVLLPGELDKVHESATNNFIIKEASWFNVNYGKAAGKFMEVFTQYDKFKENAEKLAKRNKKKFSEKKMIEEFQKILDEEVQVKEQREFKLPELPNLKGKV